MFLYDSHTYLKILSRMKIAVIVDVVYVNNVMWTVGWERGGRGKSQGVGQLLLDKGLERMGIRHHGKKAGSPST
jgi:hypothetical protein